MRLVRDTVEPVKCSFCDRTEDDGRLFSAPGPGGERKSICANCLRSFQQQARPAADEPVDLLAQMARRMRMGMRQPAFVHGLVDQYIEHATEQEKPAVAELAARWKALVDPGCFDDAAAEALRQDIVSQAADEPLAEQLQRPYETWLRMARLGES